MSKLPQPASRLRPPTRLGPPIPTAPAAKRQASDDNIPYQSPSKRSRRLAVGSTSSSIESNSVDNLSGSTSSISSMGPPTVGPRRVTGTIAKNKMRRSVSMATIPVGAAIRTAAVAATRGGGIASSGYGALSRSSSKLSGSNINITGRPSSVTARAPVGAVTGVRRPGTNITSRINNTMAGRPGVAGTVTPSGAKPVPRKPSTAAPAAAAAALPLDKGRGRRPAWDVKGRLEDMEEVVRHLRSEVKDKQHLDTHLTETLTVKEAKEQELGHVTRQLRELESSSQATIHTMTITINQLQTTMEHRDRTLNVLKMELDLKLEEMMHLKRSLSETSSAKTIMEAQITSYSSQVTSKDITITDLNKKLLEALDSVVDLKEKITHGEHLRKKLHNKVQELKGNIRVFCRVRPLIGDEIVQNGGDDTIHHINVLSETSLELLKGAQNCDNSSMSGLKSRGNGAVEFAYDRVFGPKDTQADVFEEVSQLVQSALDGYNVCVFAYGQTGSGKTYTMEGVPDCEVEAGIIPRTVAHIFAEMDRQRDHGWDFSLEASFLEIYNETIRDLLATTAEARHLTYDIKMTDSRSPHTHVTNLRVVPVEEAGQIYSLLHIAQQHRAVAATSMNLHSSRSHSVFRMSIRGTNARTQDTCEGSLSLVDLAGSERLKESGSTGVRLTETQNINKSLSNLGNVIMALGQKQNHIPYRNSKLTHLLQPSLGGNSKTLMLVNVSPLDGCVNETINSLRFATKVNTCHIGAATKQAKKV